MRYGGASEDEALRMITPQPGLDHRRRRSRRCDPSVGKDADLVPLGRIPVVEFCGPGKVLIDGRLLLIVRSQLRHAALPGGPMRNSSPLPVLQCSVKTASGSPPWPHRQSSLPARPGLLPSRKPIVLKGGKLLTSPTASSKNGVLGWKAARSQASDPRVQSKFLAMEAGRRHRHDGLSRPHRFGNIARLTNSPKRAPTT